MAGHIPDRWYKTETGPDGVEVKVKTDRYGTGMRYRARYIGPDGTEKSKSFPDRQKGLAEKWLIGSRPLDSFRPEHIRGLVSALENDPAVSGGYARNIYGDVQTVLSAVVDDGLLPRKPCSGKSVRRWPKPSVPTWPHTSPSRSRCPGASQTVRR